VQITGNFLLSNNFENRLKFGKVIAKNKVPAVCGTQADARLTNKIFTMINLRNKAPDGS